MCTLHTRRDQRRGRRPALGVDTGCAFPDSAALKTAVDSCLAVDPTGVACCSHGADCGAAGTVEMADWDVSLVTSMSQLFKSKASFNADISRWDVSSSVTSMYRMFYSASNVQRGYIAMGRQLSHEHESNVCLRQLIQQVPAEMEY